MNLNPIVERLEEFVQDFNNDDVKDGQFDEAIEDLTILLREYRKNQTAIRMGWKT